MAFLVIAIVLVIIGIVVWLEIDTSPAGCILILAFIFLCLGLFANWGGYEKAVVSDEIELMPLIENANIYLIQSDDETKMCKYMISSERDTKIKNEAIKRIRSSVEVEYIDEGSKPVLREYTQKTKESIWNGLYVDDKKELVLFVPESYILK